MAARYGLKTIALLTVCLPAALAGAGAAAAPKVEEVIVTATKRAQSVQKVGVAITALGKETIKAIGRQDVTALAVKVPSLQVNQYSPTVTVFNLRGVSQNDFTDAQEAPVAFYQDEVYISALGAISGMNFDLDRVEVLRGPQGTLFGRNATGGLVQFLSARPTSTRTGFLSLTGADYGQFSTEGAIGGRITEGVNGRFAFTTNNADGYIRNLTGPDIGDANNWALRGQVEINLSPEDTLLLKAQILRNDHERNAGLYSSIGSVPNDQGLAVPIGPNDDFYGLGPGTNQFGYRSPRDPFTQSYDRVPLFDRTFVDVAARYTHKFDWATLTSITDYQNLKKAYGEDSDVSPLPVFNYDTRQHLYQVSQELRLAGDVGRLHWLGGLYGLNVHTRNNYRIDGSQILGFIGDYGGVLDTKGVAAFTRLEYAVTPDVTLIGGVRYSFDRKELQYADRTNGVEDFNYETTYPALAPNRVQNYSNWNGNLEADWRPVEGLLLYASINRGTKAGGFNTLSGPLTEAQVRGIPFGQEVLVNAEGGFKWTLLDRTTHLNMSLFHYDYDGYQAFTNVGLSQIVSNSQATEQGLEIEADTRIVPNLFLSGFAVFLDNTIKGLRLPAGQVVDRRLPQAPHTSIGFSGRYELPLGPGELALGTDWKYDSVQFLEAYNGPTDREPQRIIGNVRLSYALEGGKWEAVLFANNVTDKRYRIYNLDLAGLLGLNNQTYARPRVVGGTVTYRF